MAIMAIPDAKAVTFRSRSRKKETGKRSYKWVDEIRPYDILECPSGPRVVREVIYNDADYLEMVVLIKLIRKGDPLTYYTRSDIDRVASGIIGRREEISYVEKLLEEEIAARRAAYPRQIAKIVTAEMLEGIR